MEMHKRLLASVLIGCMMVSLLMINLPAAYGNGNYYEAFYEDFESYEVGSFPSSSFRLQYNGTGNANQKVIAASQHDNSAGKVFRLQGASGWAAEADSVLPYPLPDVVVIDVYAKPVSGSRPGDIGLVNHGVGTWGT